MLAAAINPFYIYAFIALVGPLAAYWVSVRHLSGRIDTSTAEDLWTESRSLRAEYRTQISDLQQRIVRFEAVVAELQKHVEDCDARNLELTKEVEELKRG